MITKVIVPPESRPSAANAAAPKLGRDHLAFFRGYLSGLPLRNLADRYLDPGLDLRRVKTTLRWIQDELSVAARRQGRPAAARLVGLDLRGLAAAAAAPAPSLEDFRSRHDPDGVYGESELLALYREAHAPDRRQQRNQRLRQRQLEALQWVEALVVADPVPADPLVAWLPSTLAARLESAGFTSLGALIRHINARGQRWWATIPGVGPRGAQRVTAWLERHADSLGQRIDPSAGLRYRVLAERRRAERQQAAAGLPPTTVAPLEYLPALPVPARSAAVTARLTAPADDRERVLRWLEARASNPHTRRAYRKEAERLLLWARIECTKTLDQLTPADCQAYLGFLADPQPADRWIARGPTPRHDPDWRPFDRPPSTASQRQARTILAAMFAWLTAAGELPADPWPIAARQQRSAPTAPGTEAATARSLDPAQWQAVRDVLDRLPRDEASARLRFLASLAYSTGLRPAEMVSARVDDLLFDRSEPTVAGRARGTSADRSIPRPAARLRVGDGVRQRLVPLADPLLAELATYLQARGLDPEPARCPPGTRLVAPLSRHPVASAGAPLTAPALYRLFKSLFATAADSLRRHAHHEAAARLAQASTHWLRHSVGRQAVDAGVPLGVIRTVLGHASLASLEPYARPAHPLNDPVLLRFIAERPVSA
jgi:integrase